MNSELINGLKKLTSTEYPTDHIPIEERLPVIVPTIAWLGFAMFMFTYLIGGVVGISTGSLGRGLLAIFIGNIFLAVYLGLHGQIAIRTGLTSNMLAMYSFGRRGAVIPAFNFGDIGWSIVMVAIFAWAVSGIWDIDARVLALAFGLLFLTGTFIGIRGIYWISLFQLIIMVLMGIVALYTVIMKTPAGLVGLFTSTFPEKQSFAMSVTMIIGLFANGVTRGGDLIRWGRKPWHAWVVGFVAFGLGAMFCALSGALISAATGITDTFEALKVIGLVGLGLVLFFCLSWTTTDVSAYLASLAFTALPKAAIERDVNRRNVAIIIAAIVMLGAAAGLHRYIVDWLILMGIYMPAVGGVIIADFYIMNFTKYHWMEQGVYEKRRINDAEVIKFKFNWVVIPAIVLGTIVGYYTTYAHPTGIPPVYSILTSIVVYTVISYARGIFRLKKKINERSAIQID
ncbi:cytosine permease [Desulfallas sp. Bu1-1]|nr:cytosine permease [Desulfallas sp. Bu1-1]